LASRRKRKNRESGLLNEVPPRPVAEIQMQPMNSPPPLPERELVRKTNNYDNMANIESTQYAIISGQNANSNSNEPLDAYQRYPAMAVDDTAKGSVRIVQKSEDVVNLWEIPFEELDLGIKIGEGAYGEVYKGSWRNQDVAIKKVLGGLDVSAFMEEAKLMLRLRPHENVVLFLGVVRSPLCIVLKFYDNGSLYTYLKSANPISLELKLKMMKGTAAGVAHLHREKVIHRDLAARNILLNGRLEAVVSDFGFARLIQNDTSVATTKGNIGPIKHMAPESLTNHQYSEKTDSWSFGIVCWEILTRKEPYPDLDYVNTISFVLLGKRLDIPSDVPPTVASMLKRCWDGDPNVRPSLQECFNVLHSVKL